MLDPTAPLPPVAPRRGAPPAPPSAYPGEKLGKATDELILSFLASDTAYSPSEGETRIILSSLETLVDRVRRWPAS